MPQEVGALAYFEKEDLAEQAQTRLRPELASRGGGECSRL